MKAEHLSTSRSNRNIMFALNFAGVLVLTALYLLLLSKYNAISPIELYYAKGLIVYSIIYIAILPMITNMYGGYRIGILSTFEIAYSQILSLVFVNGITYFQISLIAKGFLPVGFMLALTLGQAIFIIFWSILSTKIYYKIHESMSMILIYGGEYPIDLMENLKTISHRYHLKKVMDQKDLNLGDLGSSFNDIEVVMVHDIDLDLRSRINTICFEADISLYIIPEIGDIVMNNANQTQISDTPLLLCRNDSLSIEQEVVKRALDILMSAAILIVLLPLMLLAALAIKINDGGPILYKQERLTKGGKTFIVYKLRSMILDAESDGIARLAQKEDDRITPVGKLIRTIRFDEIPQFFNVLMGDMSVVGPRPERPEIAKKYEEQMPEFAYRLKMKAGITGYAQVYGKYNTTPRDKLILDIIYINNYSLIFDIRMILMTIKIIFLPGKTEGVS